MRVEKVAREQEDVILEAIEEKEPLPDKEADQDGIKKESQTSTERLQKRLFSRVDLCLNEEVMRSWIMTSLLYEK